MYLSPALFYKTFEMTHNSIHSNIEFLPVLPPKKESEPCEELLA